MKQNFSYIPGLFYFKKLISISLKLPLKNVESNIFIIDLFFFSLQDNLSFPLICPDWNADDEILLLEVLSERKKI